MHHILVPGWQVHAFIRRMDIVIRQAAAYETDFNTANILQHGHHANRTPSRRYKGCLPILFPLPQPWHARHCY